MEKTKCEYVKVEIVVFLKANYAIMRVMVGFSKETFNKTKNMDGDFNNHL